MTQVGIGPSPSEVPTVAGGAMEPHLRADEPMSRKNEEVVVPSL